MVARPIKRNAPDLALLRLKNYRRTRYWMFYIHIDYLNGIVSEKEKVIIEKNDHLKLELQISSIVALRESTFPKEFGVKEEAVDALINAILKSEDESNGKRIRDECSTTLCKLGALSLIRALKIFVPLKKDSGSKDYERLFDLIKLLNKHV